MKRVMFVEFPVFERMTPLVSGYLQAYAIREPALRGEYEFQRYTAVVRTPANTIIRDLVAAAADVYAFSCYVWNMGLVRSIMAALRPAMPRAQIILGGPQVMNQALRYLNPADERTVICNGEGEVTFSEYLLALVGGGIPDFSLANGLSFYRSGELVTTEKQPRISNLDDIPSPFLTGVFGAGYSMSILETNRGCPFRCGFCYWGAATNDRVYRFGEQRVCDEVTWMARNDVLFLYIADANWGMLGRDIDISRHIAECARSYGLPNVIYFSAAKNKPHAVTQITSIFKDAGLIASQPISMQTLEPLSLDLISRSNIKLTAFAAVQEDLSSKGMSSFIELIWPLPGETLDSFRQGIGTLCENDAQTIISYPHLLLNNTPIDRQAESFGLVTRAAGGDVAEARVVTATKHVSEEAFADGMRFFYAVHALHNTRSLRAVGRYLSSRSIMSYAELFTAFVRFWRAQPSGDPIVSYVERSIDNADFYDVNNYGLFIHAVLHAGRPQFARQIRDFARSQSWWNDEYARALFDIDVLNRPYIYSNTVVDLSGETLQVLKLLNQGSRGYTVWVPAGYRAALAESVRVDGQSEEGVFNVNHKRMQYPFMPTQSLDHNGAYCHGMIEKVENIMPVWQPADLAVRSE